LSFTNGFGFDFDFKTDVFIKLILNSKLKINKYLEYYTLNK